MGYIGVCFEIAHIYRYHLILLLRAVEIYKSQIQTDLGEILQFPLVLASNFFHQAEKNRKYKQILTKFCNFLSF